MIIKLNLTANEYVRHGEIITLPAESVILAFSTPYAIDELVLTVTPPVFNGVTEPKQIKVKDGIADVTEFFNSAGTVDVTATLTIRGVPVKIWKIEPFIVKEVSGQYVAIPELEYLKSELETVKKAIAEIVKKIS